MVNNIVTLPTKTQTAASLLSLYQEIDRVARAFEMPDEAMNCLTQAAAIVREALIEAPVTCARDVAAKFHVIGHMVMDGDEVRGEQDAIAAALDGLQAMREAA